MNTLLFLNILPAHSPPLRATDTVHKVHLRTMFMSSCRGYLIQNNVIKGNPRSQYEISVSSSGMGSETHHICRQCKDLVFQPSSAATLWVWGLSRRREVQGHGSCWPTHQNLSRCGEYLVWRMVIWQQGLSDITVIRSVLGFKIRTVLLTVSGTWRLNHAENEEARCLHINAGGLSFC